MAQQNRNNFIIHEGWQHIPALKYAAHVSWYNGQQTLKFFSFLLRVFEGDKNDHNFCVGNKNTLERYKLNRKLQIIT
jgi:hypothetical protein